MRFLQPGIDHDVQALGATLERAAIL